MLSPPRGSFAAGKRLLLAERALAGTIMAFVLWSCGASDRDTDDADTARAGTTGTTVGTGGAAAGTSGTNPCASFVTTTNTVCGLPGQFGAGGTGGAAGSSGDAGASGETGQAPTIEQCMENPPFCPLPSPGLTFEVTVEDGLCCVRCSTICG
jgi:hypothetical protein